MLIEYMHSYHSNFGVCLLKVLEETDVYRATSNINRIFRFQAPLKTNSKRLMMCINTINRNSLGFLVSFNPLFSIDAWDQWAVAQRKQGAKFYFSRHRSTDKLIMNRSMKGKVMDDSIFLGGIKPIQPKRKTKRIVLGFAFVAVVLFLVGFLIGYFVRQPGHKHCSLETAAGDKSSDFEEFHELFKETISAERLESVIRYDKLMWCCYASSWRMWQNSQPSVYYWHLNQFICNIPACWK